MCMYCSVISEFQLIRVMKVTVDFHVRFVCLNIVVVSYGGARVVVACVNHIGESVPLPDALSSPSSRISRAATTKTHVSIVSINYGTT